MKDWIQYASYAFLGIAFFYLLSGPQTDRRFKTGYKNNERPDGCLKKIGITAILLLISFSLRTLHSYLDDNKNVDNKPNLENSSEVSDFILYSKPDIKSTIKARIVDQNVKIKILSSTNYFHKVEFYIDSTKYVGYVLKEKVE